MTHLNGFHVICNVRAINYECEKMNEKTYVGFPAAARQVEVQRDPQLLEGLQVVSKALPRKLPEGVLIPLGSLLHLALLEDTEWTQG